jgi:signal transduction histidine kinase
LLILCAACGLDEAAPRAQHGKITITPQSANRTFVLSGEWALYWNRRLTPADFRGPHLPRPDGYLEQPGGWNDFRLGGRTLGPYGVATLRLIVDPGPDKRELGLSIPQILKAYRLWVDGKLASTRGTVGDNATNEEGVPSRRLFTFEGEGRPIDIILQVSNHQLVVAGTTGDFRFGPARLVEQEMFSSARFGVLIGGCLLMMALYQFTIYVFRRTDSSPLYFGLFCLSWTAFIFIQYDREFLTVVLLPEGAQQAVLRAKWLFFYLSLPAVYAFFRSLFPQEVPASIQKVVTGAAVLLSLDALFAPLPVLYGTVAFSYVLIGLILLNCLYWASVATAKKRAGAAFMLGGFVLLAGAGLHDMWVDMHVQSSYELVPFGIFAFALSQALNLSHRSARNLVKIENLSAELDTKNAALELKVAETERLSSQIVRVSEEERSKISQELHDGICQILTAARLGFSVLKKKMLMSGSEKADVDELSGLLESAVNEAYDMSLGLWPVETGTGQLATSFEELCRRTAHSGKLDITFRSSLPICPRQSPETTRHLYRIAQEALTNVAKHAHAAHVNVSIFCSPQAGMGMVVEDDGVGRAGTAGSTKGGGFGTRIMNHRAVVIGGKLLIGDRPGGGTIVSCTVPCLIANQNECPIAVERKNG